MPIIGQLEVKQGLACPICPYAVAAAGKKFLKKHFVEFHSTFGEDDNIQPISITVQRLFSTTKAPYFPVQEVPLPLVPSSWDLFKTKVIDRPAQLFTREPPVRRELTSMLRSTGWANHVEGLNPMELCRLVTPARQDEHLLQALQEQVFTYFEHALVEKSNLPRLLLQHLNAMTRDG